MPLRSWKRLAGCIAIELLTAAAGAAAGSAFQAGTAQTPSTHALVIQDRQGRRAALLNVQFSTPLAVADHMAAMAAKAYGFERAALLIRSTGNGDASPQEAVDTLGAALGVMAPAELRMQNGVEVYTGASCTHLLPDGAFGACSGASAAPLHGPIRAAFRVIDLNANLRPRGTEARYTTVQAITFGGELLIVAAPANYLAAAPAAIRMPLPAVAPDSRVEAALRAVIERVGKR